MEVGWTDAGLSHVPHALNFEATPPFPPPRPSILSVCSTPLTIWPGVALPEAQNGRHGVGQCVTYESSEWHQKGL